MTKLMICVMLFSMLGYSTAQLKSNALQNFFCNDIVNRQIKKEFEASFTYLSLSHYFAHDSQALYGFSKMFEHNWKEETSHGQNFMKYVVKRGGAPCTPLFDKPQNDTKWSEMSVLDILNIVLNLEKEVTEHLHKVHECARGDNKLASDSALCNNKNNECPIPCSKDLQSQKFSEDPHLQDFLESEYLSEQVDSIKELADLITRLGRFHSNKDLGLHMIDQELSSKYNK